MNELTKRIGTGIVLGVMVVAGLAYLPPFWFALAVAVIIFVTAVEWVSLISQSWIVRIVFMFALLALGVLYYWSPKWPGIALFCFAAVYLALIVGIAQVFIFAKAPQSKWVTTTWLRCLVALPILAGADHMMVALRAPGPLWLLYSIVLVAAFDSGGYFIGKAIGQKKLAPNVSPKKTWGGYVGGVFAGLVISAGMMYLCHFTIPLTWSMWLLAGVMTLVTSVFAVLGDLFESVQKRLANKKDSSTLLPGHGGFFDRIDGLLFVIPTMFIYHASFVFLMDKHWLQTTLQLMPKH